MYRYVPVDGEMLLKDPTSTFRKIENQLFPQQLKQNAFYVQRRFVRKPDNYHCLRIDLKAANVRFVTFLFSRKFAIFENILIFV